jgi:hypothetical protein
LYFFSLKAVLLPLASDWRALRLCYFPAGLFCWWYCAEVSLIFVACCVIELTNLYDELAPR